MTTRGIAVISGSNAVVARIMEDGTAIFGENKPINLKISGNLVLDLSGSSGTSGYLFINSSGSSSIQNSTLESNSINLNGSNISLGGTGSVGIVREIQQGNSITVTNGSSSIATIALSNTVSGITNLSADNISSSNFTGNGSNITNINTSNINNLH